MNAFPASRIAFAAGWQKRRVLAHLAGIAPSEKVTVSGNRTDAWTFDQLPAALQQQLRETASKKGYRHPSEMLENPEKRWLPQVPARDIPAKDWRYAEKLRDALRPLLVEQGNPFVNVSETKAQAVQRYCAIFRVPKITARHLDRLVGMVMARDRGFEEYERLDLYLPEKISACKVAVHLPQPGGISEDSAIAQAVVGLECSAEISLQDRAAVWRAAVETVLDLENQGCAIASAKRQVRKEIARIAPWIGKSQESLKKGLNAKLRQAKEQGLGSISDRREQSGNFRRPDFAEDRLALMRVATAHQGNISLAHRLLFSGWTDPCSGQALQFSQDYRDYIAFDARRDKSYVPQFMRASVRGPVNSIAPHRLGPNAASLARPARFRDWSAVKPNDWHISDDETANSMVFWPDPDGDYECDWGRFSVGRPQILPLYDLASDMPLALVVSPTASYSSDTIRELIVPTWMDPRIGLPFQGAYFERGVWKSKNVRALASWSKVDSAFHAQGIELCIRHATTPRAKTIERIFGMEQNRTAAFPGYVGRGNKGEMFERVHRFMQSLKRVGQPRKQAVDPREKLWSLDRFTTELEGIMRDFAAEPQNGERFRGRSPEEIWQEGQNGTPHKVLPPSLEYLLSTKQIAAKVTTDGIILRIGSDRYQYCANSRLGLLVGESVNVRFAGRIPDHILITHPATDPGEKSPIVVPLRAKLPAMNATREDFQRARAEETTFTKAQKALFRLLVPKNNITLQSEDFGTEDLRETGRAIQSIEEEIRLEKKDQAKARGKAALLGQRFGLDTRGVDPRRVVAALDDLEETERRILEKEAIRDAEDFLANPTHQTNE